MKFSPALQQGVLLRRYKRFLADVRLANGEEVTLHCPNTGSRKNCLAPGEPCWFSRSDNPKRKYAHTWEIATTPAGHLAGINTGRANALVEEALAAEVIAPLRGYERVRREVRYGQENSRIDFLLERATERCYLEVKSVTLYDGDGQGLFPDSVSARGTKHLRELMAVVDEGQRAVLLYCVQHSGIERVAPAAAIDPVYTDTLRAAVAAGVEVYAYGASLSAEEILLRRQLPFELPA